MVEIPGSEGLRLKLMAVMLAFALIPVISIGYISLTEMNQASTDVQEKISSLTTTLNRSALYAASNQADQVQLASAKAGQYDSFFSRIAVETDTLASYTASYTANNTASHNNTENQSYALDAGIWIAPNGPNQTLLEEKKATLISLSAPSRLLKGITEGESASTLCYIGTEDGVLIIWPNINQTLFKLIPFDHRNRPSYLVAKLAERTAWTSLYNDVNGLPAVTCATPIYKDDKHKELFGVAGMDVSLASIYNDMSSMNGRGYPFIIDAAGAVVMRPKSQPEGIFSGLFASENLSQINNSEIRELVRKMGQGKAGSSVVGLDRGDGYVAFAPIPTLGWSLGLAYPTEEMSLPARFIDAGIKDVAKSATEGLGNAVGVTRDWAVVIVILTSFLALASGLFIYRRISAQIDSIYQAVNRISRGDPNLQLNDKWDKGTLGLAFSDMVRNLRQSTISLKQDAEESGSMKKEKEVIAEIKHSLDPGHIPQVDGYELAGKSMRSEGGSFDFYDILSAGDDEIVLIMGDVPGSGVQAGMLAIMSRTLIHASSWHKEPAKVMSEANLNIIDKAKGTHLASVYIILNTINHTLDCVNAGFTPPFVVDQGGSIDTLGGGGIALGMLDRIDLKPECIPIQPGDVLVIYSNGVTEASNGSKKPFGIERLITLVIDNRSLSASEIVRKIEKEIRTYIKDQHLQDDSTLLVLKRT